MQAANFRSKDGNLLARYGLVICFLFVASETKIDARHRISIGIRANVRTTVAPISASAMTTAATAPIVGMDMDQAPPLGGKQLGPAGDESI
jgi:hypothetical protein